LKFTGAFASHIVNGFFFIFLVEKSKKKNAHGKIISFSHEKNARNNFHLSEVWTRIDMTRSQFGRPEKIGQRDGNGHLRFVDRVPAIRAR